MTWCNRFAIDMAEDIAEELGGTRNSPFKELIDEKTIGYISASTLHTWLNEKRGSSGNFVAVDSLEKAWTEYANKGHLVWFHDRGHIATAIPTTELIERGGHKVGKVIQAGSSVGIMYLSGAWSSNSFGNIVATAYMKDGW